MEKEFLNHKLNVTRRHFLGKTAIGLGAMGLGSLLMPDLFTGSNSASLDSLPLGIPHFAPKAKKIIYLFQNGAPSQLETFDYKPTLIKRAGEDLPESIRGSQRLTGMTSNQKSFPMVGSKFGFQQYGKSGAWISDVFPNIAKIADDICIVKSMHTEAINHDPALTFMQTGAQIGNRPSMGAWMSYGLGSENKNLPAYCVLLSRGKGNGQGVYSKLWSNGFLDSTHQGVIFSSGEDPILYLNDPEALDKKARRKMLDKLAELNGMGFEQNGDPEIQAKVQQYEMAYRMQTAVPELTDLSKEPDHIIKMYGPECLIPGTYAANALMARKLSESGVRFVQLYHQGWDQHGNLPNEMAGQAMDVDRASAALITDLKQRGLLDETLVIWGGEFGRTNYCQGSFTKDNYGRDHHPRAYSIWMAGGGIKPGTVYGETDEFGYNIIKDPVHVNDFHATVMHLAGLDHEKLTYKHLGRRYRLTDVAGKLVPGILA
ncbi:Tat (twin-arginine translocation) pathway signal sequence [Spirosomataceae bacterium TFI 002]|nr:Tat (twin-arginine translocation) pathway signal sequence [Spirosomataceae bacterium TFI 002]